MVTRSPQWQHSRPRLAAVILGGGATLLGGAHSAPRWRSLAAAVLVGGMGCTSRPGMIRGDGGVHAVVLGGEGEVMRGEVKIWGRPFVLYRV